MSEAGPQCECALARLVFGAAVTLGAFLLFQLEPMIAKRLLPWFGGAPSVWTTCVLFFQALLLGGYAYAHLLVGKLPARVQTGVHMALLTAGAGVLAFQVWQWGTPLLLNAGWHPADSARPIPRLLAALAIGTGLPFFALAAASPLLQAWFGRSAPNRSPYPLYALSNAGSLAALLTYPLIFEPALDLERQAWTWTGMFAVFAACCAWCGREALRAAPEAKSRTAEPEPAPNLNTRLLWLALPATASLLLLAATNQMCQEVAVVPFLWVLPLGLYLLSFVLCFGSGRWYKRDWMMLALFVTLVPACWSLHKGQDLSIVLHVPIISAVLLAACMVCHGELARIKPNPDHLTGYYMAIALGGTVGSAFVSLAAPVLFKGFWEYHIGLGLTFAMLIWALYADRSSWLHTRPSRRAPFWVNLGLLAAFLIGNAMDHPFKCVLAGRNFYGTIRVETRGAEGSDSRRLVLRNGAILHGFQFEAPSKRNLPFAYYGATSGFAMAMRLHPARSASRPMKIGIIGLGVGTGAAYGQDDDQIVFYELNPDVIRLSDPISGLFTYLRDSKARVRVVAGDARLSLERALAQNGPEGFDLLVVDAFTSDSIPAHLLTREAWNIYLAHLGTEGALALNLSNRHLDLRPVAQALAEQAGMKWASVSSETDLDKGFYAATWFVAAKTPGLVDQPEFEEWTKVQWNRPPLLWTDRKSSILPLLKW